MVVLEIIGSEGKVPRFERPSVETVRIGRAMDNDIIIDDPYIDPHHVEIRLGGDEGWVVVDLGSVNGTTKDNRTIRVAALASGDELLIGKTVVRIFAVDHVVAPTRSLRDFEHVLLRIDSFGTLLPLLVLMAGIPLLTMYLGSAGAEIKPDMIASAVIAGLVFPLSVAAFWSFVARLLRGESRFRVILNITMMFALASILVTPLVRVGYYNFPGVAGAATLQMLGMVGLAAAYLYIVMLVATRLKPRVSAGVAGFIAVCAIGTHVVTVYSSRDEFYPMPQYDGAVFPPVLLLRSGVTNQQYLAELPAVFDEAEENSRDSVLNSN